MNRLYIDIDSVRELSNMALRDSLGIMDAYQEIKALERSLPNNVLSRRGIQQQIQSICSELILLNDQIHNIISTIIPSCNRYEDAEEQVYQNAITEFGTIVGTISANEALFHSGNSVIGKNVPNKKAVFTSRDNSYVNFSLTRNLSKGCKGEDVRVIQELLKKCHYDLEADGIFGKITSEKIKQFQREHKLTTDGIVGPLTLEKLKKESQGENSTVIDNLVNGFSLGGVISLWNGIFKPNGRQ